MKNLLVACSLVGLLGGCDPLIRYSQSEIRAAQQACESSGFWRGTVAYSNCVEKQAAENEEDDDLRRRRGYR